jgi:hypothetical protein
MACPDCPLTKNQPKGDLQRLLEFSTMSYGCTCKAGSSLFLVSTRETEMVSFAMGTESEVPETLPRYFVRYPKVLFASRSPAPNLPLHR